MAIRQLSVNPIQTLRKQIHPEASHAEGYFLKLIYSLHFINPTSTPHRPYIEPTSTPHRPYIDPTSTPHDPHRRHIDPTSTPHRPYQNNQNEEEKEKQSK